MSTPQAEDGNSKRPPQSRRQSRRALYAATVLAPLSGLALFAVVRGGALAPVQPAVAQQLPADEGQPDQGAARPGQLRPFAVAAAPANGSAIAGGALGVLLEQANFWRARQRYDQAITSLKRALDLSPDNADALALMAQVQSEKGDKSAASVALAHLKQVAPDDARIERIDQAIRVGPISQDQLAEARKLAQSGKQADAIERYNRVFKGNPPPDALAVEYYQTLAGAEGGYDPAKDGLARLVRQDPKDLRAQLAYAQVLTYRDAGRLEGIQRLSSLAQNPEIAEQATQAWRQALGWLPDSKDAIDPIQNYLASHPNDTDLATKLAQAKNPLLAASPPVRARLQGFDSLNKGKLADAEKQFQQAIDANADDADATGGLGLVRLRQRNLADAKTLLARAIALDPEHKGRWQSALTAASNPGGGPNPAVALINHGDFAGAQRELDRQGSKGGDVAGLQGMLADAQARQGRLEEAEATYRAALGHLPNNAQLLVGLAGVLSRQGRGQEASELLDRAQAVAGNSRLVGQARALQLREQANAITDPGTQVGLYRAAVGADPENPWLRLDLARALFKLGQAREARDVMAGVIGTSPTPDALKAGIIFANETSDPDAAATLIARLPPAMRTPDMLTLQVQAVLQREIGTALMLSRPVARQRLLAMAAQPDPTGARGAAIAKALGEIGDKAAARDAVITAQASTLNQSASARLRYAGALMDLDDPQGASDMMVQAGPARSLTAADRQQLAQLQAGLAVRTSDKLNEQGRQADAYEHLAPALARAPENPDLNLALARLYQGARNPREALQISESLLRRDPANVEARKSAVEAALQMGDRRLADTLVREGIQLAPNDPQTWIMSADLEKARGNNAHALRDLERARGLRLQQLGYTASDTGADDAAPPGVSLVPGAAPVYQPAAPRPVYRPVFPSADGGADQPPDLSVPPLLRDRAPPPSAEPLPPFRPQPTTAVGTAPSYEPPPQPAAPIAPAHRLLDTSATEVPPPAPAPSTSADQLNGQELGRDQAQDAPQQYAPAAYQPPAYQPQVYQPPVYQPPVYQPQVYQPQVYQPETPQPPFARPSPYQPPAYQPPNYLGQTANPPPSRAAAAPPPRYRLAQPQPAYAPQSAGQEAPYAPPQYLQQYAAPYEPAPQPQYQAPRPMMAAPRPINPFPARPVRPVETSPGYYANPFRQGPGDTLADTELPGAPAPDPVTAEIDKSIVALRDTVAPSLQGGFGFRNRSGQSGLDQLTELTVPMEATFAPGGFGQVKLSVTPTILSSGTVGGSISNQQQFGSNALGLRTNFSTGVTTLPTGTQADQSATGLGLDVSYKVGNIGADIGSTPFGFRQENIVGGVEWAPRLGDHARLRLLGERRAVTDSILSYAGTVDTRTGERWGGVVQDHARATLEFSAGKADFYVLGGVAEFTGDHVQHNSEFEAGAGGSFPIYHTPTQEVRVGLDLIYFGYQHNQDYFTLGQGGYFSPQSFTAAMVPVTYKETVDEDLSYEVGAAAGMASFRQAAQPYYPIDSNLQAELIAQQSGSSATSGVLSEFPSSSKSGFSGTAHASVDYRVSPSLRLGGKVDFAHSPAFDQTTGTVYAKYLFNGADK